MKTRALSQVVCCLLGLAMHLHAQDTPPTTPPVPATVTQPETIIDPFGELRKQADLSRDDYVRARDESLASIDKQVATKKCQMARISPAIQTAIDALEAWYPKEREYWKRWNAENADKAQRTMKQIENQRADQADAKRLKDSYEEELARLQKEFGDNQSGPQNPETRKRADLLKDLMKEREDDISAQIKKYDELDKIIVELNGSYDLDLTKTRENLRQVEYYYGTEKASWAEKRTLAEKVCGNEKPNTATPLPKGGRGGQQ